MRKMRILRVGLPLLALLVIGVIWAVTAFGSSEDAVWPEPTGTVRTTDGKLLMDSSHAEDGYIMLCVTKPSKHAMKVRITKDKAQLTYDLNNEGNWVAFPLQLGSGSYSVALYENVKSNKYSAEGKIDFKVKLTFEDAPFLAPNPYVDYDILTAAVQKSDELCAEADPQKPEEAFKIITDYMASEYAYDFIRAKTIQAGALPDIDYCYENKMGICQDLSAVMVCMLRVQGVPSKLVIGYADKYYHAWTSTVVDGREIFFDPTAALGALNAKKYQVERMY